MPYDLSEAKSALARIAAGASAKECETDTLDFKQDRPTIGETERLIADAAICFANSAGGILVAGVSDRIKGIDAFLGTHLSANKVRQRVYELSRPPLNVEAFFHEKYNILFVLVPQSSVIHSDTQGRATRRINLDCLPMSPDDIARLREERQGIDWSAKATAKQWKDVTDDSINIARSILIRFQDERRRLATASRLDLLRGLGVIDQSGNLNQAGELLFCKSASNASILYQYRSTPGGEPRAVERIDYPLITAFTRAIELISARGESTPVNLPNGQQISLEDFPQLAVREALSNAICHRDYHLDGVVVIDHSPETLSVNSPGPLVAGVTTTNIITTVSRPRNPALAKAARTLGFAEELGRGIDRMYREMIRSGRKTPSIESTFDNVRVAFVGGAPDTNIAKFVASLPEAEQEDTDTMLVLLRLCSTRTVTASTVAAFLQKSIAESEVILRRLADDSIHLLERTRASVGRSAGTYRLRGESLKGLGAAVAYQRRTTDDIDRKVILHVREYGKITNKTLQNFFDVHVFKARDIISDLVKRNILVRTSINHRGPKVEWGPGASFPVEPPRKRTQKKEPLP